MERNIGIEAVEPVSRPDTGQQQVSEEARDLLSSVTIDLQETHPHPARPLRLELAIHSPSFPVQREPPLRSLVSPSYHREVRREVHPWGWASLAYQAYP